MRRKPKYLDRERRAEREQQAEHCKLKESMRGIDFSVAQGPKRGIDINLAAAKLAAKQATTLPANENS